MSVRSILQQLDRDISARGMTRQDVCEKAGLNRGLITQWHLMAGRKPEDSHVFRASSYNKIHKALKEIPLLQQVKSNGTDELPLVERVETTLAPLFDDTREPTPAPTIKDRLSHLEQMAAKLDAAAVPPAIPVVGVAVDVPQQQKGNDALRVLILDHLLKMDTVKLALVYAHIINEIK